MAEHPARARQAWTPYPGGRKRTGRVLAGLMVLTLGLGHHAAAPTSARSEEKKPGEGPSEADLRLDLSGMGLPVLQDGRVMNYVFVRLRINFNPGIARPDIEAGEPFIRERMLKSSYRTPLNSGTDLMALDPKKLEALTISSARAVYGAAKVRSVEVRDQKPQKRLYSTPASGGPPRQPIRP